ncbi:pentapeptide repeat-containing protein [Nonomuraea sp. SYSU D8015]|uniref:pentapeptide repeat-containing protein n=1 Tax=Nonomuraea sp. SYSU D8015 TaxID=2593644 RepID=UPI001CB6D9E5|nr:pentapeptide repeat-containing protein [Nonomuraea sp. SYSU D8015]
MNLNPLKARRAGRPWLATAVTLVVLLLAYVSGQLLAEWVPRKHEFYEKPPVWPQLASGAPAVIITVLLAAWALTRQTMDRARARRVPAPTATELAALPVKDREELLIQRQQARTQWISGTGVVLSVAFTAFGLMYTALTLEATREAQITDRYIKNIEQLGSSRLDVRLGAIYALERLARDSPRDHDTIYDVLTAFVREHDPEVKPPAKPATDIQAALTVIGRGTAEPYYLPLNADLGEIRAPGASLDHSNLIGSDLRLADLSRANLVQATLIDANLSKANLSKANLSWADLSGANLSGADLSETNLSGANLSGTDLKGADLRGVRGMTPDQIRRVAVTDKTTRF